MSKRAKQKAWLPVVYQAHNNETTDEYETQDETGTEAEQTEPEPNDDEGSSEGDDVSLQTTSQSESAPSNKTRPDTPTPDVAILLGKTNNSKYYVAYIGKILYSYK